MAQITINIPADKTTWILDGLALRFQYQDNVEVSNPSFDASLGVDPSTNPLTMFTPNPQSKVSFAKDIIKGIIKKEAAQGYINAEYKTYQDLANLVDLT